MLHSNSRFLDEREECQQEPQTFHFGLTEVTMLYWCYLVNCGKGTDDDVMTWAPDAGLSESF